MPKPSCQSESSDNEKNMDPLSFHLQESFDPCKGSHGPPFNVFRAVLVPRAQGTEVGRVHDQMHLENAVDCISLLDIPSGREQINSSGRSRSKEIC